MGSSKSPKMEVTQYYMSIHFGIAAGPLDEIQSIVIDKKEAWSGNMSARTDFQINKSELFGGLKKEGGVQGTVSYLPGDGLQIMPDFLARRLRLTPETCPAYRGLSSIFFHGGQSGGFYWRANSPYLPGAWIKARRRPKGLDVATSMIGPDANPAHIIYECLTDTDWGMGASPQSINIQSFLDGAQTLFNEQFGISLLWTQQETIENFVTGIINHIEAVLFVNPRDGLLTLKLIRDDYDPETLFEITPDNATLSKFSRKLWGETANEVIVTYTNPENEEELTVGLQDPANITMQGAVVTQPKEYKGIRNADLAMKVCSRDLRVAASPLASCEALINRSAWDIVPGGVVRVTWPKHGMQKVVMRVGNVDYGKTSDSKVRVQLVEDVFSLPQANYVTPPTTGWIDPSETPVPIVYALPFTLPYYFVRNTGTDYAGNTYPEVVAGVLGAQPGQDTAEFTLAYEVTNAAGVGVIEEGSTLTITSRALIDTALPFEATSIVAVRDVTQGNGATVGSFALLGTADENMEMCVVSQVVGNIVTLTRGVLDTTPKAWDAGTPIWFIDDGSVIDDSEIRVGGQTVEYHLLSITSKGMLSVADAPAVDATLTERPWLPSRPANVQVNGIANGLVNAEGQTSVRVTWANRNRLMEDAVVLKWNEATVTPESGQTTTITVMDMDRNVLSTHGGLTGTSFDLPSSAWAGEPIGIVRVTSKRDDLESLQGHEIIVRVSASGWGQDWGTNYGG